MPRLPKPDRLRQRTRESQVGMIALDGGACVTPPPPRAWLASTAAAWRAYWASPLARAAQIDTDTPAIERLFGLRDERERMSRVVRRSRVVLGSAGQPRANPLYAQITAFDAEIRQLEDRLGLSPIARLRLGVTFGDAARSLADLNRELASDDPAPSADLRLTLVAAPPANPRPRRPALDGAQPGPRTG
ncbi:MAG TPA: P27 family phage terminase small subunit [Patescibacteria group bacterium]|nr:P27 family phage terminase small subunit [Patescibacteria group bacterium]